MVARMSGVSSSILAEQARVHLDLLAQEVPVPGAVIAGTWQGHMTEYDCLEA